MKVCVAIGERDGKRKGIELARGPEHLTLLLLEDSRNSSMKARTLIFFSFQILLF